MRRCQTVRHFASLSCSGQAKNESAGSSPAFRSKLVSQLRGGVAKTARHLPCKQVDAGGNPASSSRFRWRDWPNGLGTGLWLQSREFDSLISPQWAVRIKELPTACNREMRVRVSHRPPKLSRFAGVSEAGARRRNPEPRTLRRRIWLGNSTAECWSEKPVDTVQFRAEPPDRNGECCQQERKDDDRRNLQRDEAR